MNAFSAPPPLETRLRYAPDGAAILEILDRHGRPIAFIYTTCDGVRIDSYRPQLMYLSMEGAAADETRPCVIVTFADFAQ